MSFSVLCGNRFLLYLQRAFAPLRIHLGVFVLLTVIVREGHAFDTSLFTPNTLFIEAEDADFGHGQFVTNKTIGMDGPYDGGAYRGLGTQADLEFDWHAGGPD